MARSNGLGKVAVSRARPSRRPANKAPGQIPNDFRISRGLVRADGNRTVEPGGTERSFAASASPETQQQSQNFAAVEKAGHDGALQNRQDAVGMIEEHLGDADNLVD